MSIRQDSAARDQWPEPFGKYLLLERIGAGGMAEVFKGIVSGPQGFQRSLVIKRMLPQLSQDASFVQMFIDEAKLSGLLSHPNLVQIFEFGKVADSYFIAMEHVHGRTLSQVKTKLAETGRVAPIAASVEIARQICVGLHYAHSLQSPEGKSLGIVHRDISPPNLMLAFHGGVKILDFGIARVAAGLRESRTQIGMMKGKIAYMSPEQLKLDDIDHRSDIFAVGIVLHEILTGRRLFRAGSDYESSRMVLELEITPPSLHNPEIPPELDRIVKRALERNLEERYQSAGEMASDLERVMMDNRYSAHEQKRLLHDLFPVEATQGTDAGLMISQSIPSMDQAVNPGDEQPTSHLAHEAISSSGVGSRPHSIGERSSLRLRQEGQATPTQQQPPPRSRLGVIAMALVVVLAIGAGAVVLRRPKATTGAPGTASIADDTGRPTKAAPASVRVSIDSAPQDARVTRVDTSEVLGQTPFTIDLPPTAGVVVLRFEKAGYEPVIHKILADLDKAVRVDLPALPVAEAPRPAGDEAPSAPLSPSRPRETSHSAPHGRHTVVKAPVAKVEPAKGECSMSVGTYPWTELWIDGKDVGRQTPAVHFPLPCGKHKLRFKRDALQIDHVVEINLQPGHEFKQSFDLASDDN